MKAKLTIHEDEPQTETHSIVELDAAIASATEEAVITKRPNIVFVEAPNGNSISLVVGELETVLGFTYAHNNPPYYVSKGIAEGIEPVLTAYVALSHHTEFPRRSVIPWADGIRALHEFVESGELPAAIEWEET
jgi:immunity protein Imm1 of predicted polymorphic toxin system